MERVKKAQKSIFDLDKLNGKFRLSSKDLSEFMLSILSFFVSRVIVFTSFSPLAIAYSATFLGLGGKFYVSAVLSIAGILTKMSFEDSLKYILCYIILGGMNIIMGRLRKSNSIIHICSSAVVLGICGCFLVFLFNLGIYQAFMSVLEAVLTFTFSIILSKSVSLIDHNSPGYKITNEDFISIALLICGCIAGMADIFIGDVSLRFFFSSLIIMIFSFNGGIAIGATSGFLIGILLYLTGFEGIEFVLVMTSAGFFSGVFTKLHRIFSAIAFSVSSVLFAFFLSGNFTSLGYLFSILISTVIFILIPDKFFMFLLSSFRPTIDNNTTHSQKISEIVNVRLNSTARSFEKLSKSFSVLNERIEGLTQKDISSLIDEAAIGLCMSCEKNELCWKRNFYKSYQVVLGILHDFEKKGYVDKKDVDAEFLERCIDPNGYIVNLIRVYEKYKLNLEWENRIIESRELISEQLKGVADIIKSISNEIDFSMSFDEEAENMLLSEFLNHKIDIHSLSAVEISGRYEVTVSLKPCFENNACIHSVIPLVNKVLGRSMKKQSRECCIAKGKSGSICTISLIEDQKYKLTCGISKYSAAGKDNGDTASFLQLSNGQNLLALSDGMGSGKKAKQESETAIDLLENFIESGFDKNMAIKLINSVLLLKPNKETFTTLDICSVDLYSGEADFVKIGAATSFIIRDKEIIPIRFYTLPVGIISGIELSSIKKKLQANDIIVMLSDGITDIDYIAEEKEKWLEKVFFDNGHLSPKDFADAIIDVAKQKFPNAKDDMTVIAARII